MNKELQKRINTVDKLIPLVEKDLDSLKGKIDDIPFHLRYQFRANNWSSMIEIPNSQLEHEFNNKVRAELEICQDRIIRLYEKYEEALKHEYDEL